MDRLPEEAALAQRLVRAESPSGRESPATTTLVAAFGELGYDEAYLDDAGNAIGVLRRGPGPTVMFNGHLDVVPAGDPEKWPHPPFSGTVADGQLWGRGSCDMKSAVACMAIAGRDAAEGGFGGTLIVSGVVQEEVGGLGARFLGENLQPDITILGEPSDLEFKLGHRGRVEMLVRLPGKIAHAAKASLGENALYNAAHFLAALETCEMPGGGPLGSSTATPTYITTSPGGANVVPGMAEITVDYRNVVEDEPQMAVARLEALDVRARVMIGEEQAVSENGAVHYRFPRINPAYLTPQDAPHVEMARSVIRETVERCGGKYREGVWWFATDAPYLAARGTPVIGFGPGQPERAHTTEECVPIEHLAIARTVYRQLALAYGASS